MPSLLPSTFPISWLKQAPTRKSNIWQKSQRENAVLLNIFTALTQTTKAIETYYRNS